MRIWAEFTHPNPKSLVVSPKENKKNKQRDKIIENLRQQQYKQHNQNINRQEPTNQQTNKNTNQPCQDTKYSTMQRKRKSSM